MMPPCQLPVGLRILGVDPGLNVTGYGVIEVAKSGPVVCEAGVVRGAEGRGPADMAPRLKMLYDGIVEVLEQYQPRVMSVEQLFAHYEHPRTAILMGHARGAILLAAAQHHVDVFSYGAAEIKKRITGHGRATKEQMQHAMLRELCLPVMPEPHDVADALAAALCHYHTPADPGETVAAS
jgi:crossover junction endodeoxyribonuclease RuvC